MNKKEFKKLHSSKTKSWMKKDTFWRPKRAKGLTITDAKTGEPVSAGAYAKRQKSKARDTIMSQFPADMKLHRKLRHINQIDKRLEAREKTIRDSTTPTRRPHIFVG